ncbi:MAG TPA: hypothetical protein PK711_13220 [Bacteroidales bacterium]|nr:hypothetical protein [Bacteroidales bacterium]
MKSDLDLIWGYFERDLREDEMETVEERLKGDPEFQHAFREQEEIFLSLQKTETITFRKKLRMISRELRKDKPSGRMIILSYPWFIAAAVGLLCITTGYVLLRLSAAETNPPEKISITQMEDTSSGVYDSVSLPKEGITGEKSADSYQVGAGNTESDKGLLLSDAFEINPALEKLIQLHYRNAVVRDVLPMNGHTFSAGALIWFRHNTHTDDSICLTIMDNKAGIILKTDMPWNGFQWNPLDKKGLFYFQVSTGKGIICTRKIFIR